MGGFGLAAGTGGGKCVFSSEIDPDARKTYEANFGDVPAGDITKEETKALIPVTFDVLCGGFPCQPFSVAGYRKGFTDTRGTLFYDIADIVKQRRPRVVFLENVKNLLGHDGGRTFSVIKSTLESLGCAVFFKVMNAVEYANVPQNRERIFIVCFDKEQVDEWEKFRFPTPMPLTKSFREFINEDADGDARLFYTEKTPFYGELVREIKDPNTVYQWRRQYVRENKKGVCPTLTANMGTGGHNVPLILPGGGIRKLSPEECLAFQGFPETFAFPQSISQSAKYKQA